MQVVEEEAYSAELKCIQNYKEIPKSSLQKNLVPFVDVISLSESWRPSPSFEL